MGPIRALEEPGKRDGRRHPYLGRIPAQLVEIFLERSHPPPFLAPLFVGGVGQSTPLSIEGLYSQPPNKVCQTPSQAADGALLARLPISSQR